MANIISIEGKVTEEVATLEAKVDNNLSIFVDIVLGRRVRDDNKLRSVVGIATMYMKNADDCYKTIVEAKTLEADLDLTSLGLLDVKGFSEYLGETITDILEDMK